jgi:peptidoglycan/LPS O-acetylase OafA/YrhL
MLRPVEPVRRTRDGAARRGAALRSKRGGLVEVRARGVAAEVAAPSRRAACPLQTTRQRVDSRIPPPEPAPAGLVVAFNFGEAPRPSGRLAWERGPSRRAWDLALRPVEPLREDAVIPRRCRRRGVGSIRDAGLRLEPPRTPLRIPVVSDGGHHPALDGVRGVAILLVLGQHAMTRPFIDGYVGVTVFFCLSGFLITTLLLRELHAGTIDIRAFYRRRVARLCPALATVVAVTIVVLLLERHDLRAGLAHRQTLTVVQILAPAGAVATYSTSLFDWGGHFFATYDWFNYTWSLSVEEQFYLLWPFALLLGYRRRPRLFAVLTVWLLAISLAINLYLGLSRAVKYDQHEYFGTDTNALPILAGSLLAMVVLNGWLSRTVRSLAPCALLGVALLPVVAYRNDTYRPSLVIVAGTALTLVLLAGVVTRPRSPVGWALATPPMRWLGERSYSIYLWNVLARIAILSFLGHTLLGDFVWIVMFVVLAEASFRFVERPLRTRLARRPSVPGPAALDPVTAEAPPVA